MSSVQKGKKQTKGQKQIYDENKETIRFFTIMSYATSFLYVVISYLLTPAAFWEWFGFGLSFVIQNAAIGIMCVFAKAKKNEKGVVVDAGADLNDPQALGEYFKDFIILSCILQVGACISGYFFWGFVVLPGFVIYKGVTSFLLPYLNSGTQEGEEEVADQGKKQKDRTKYKRL
uniref:Transmembrane protein 208 n=1 Tax=Rhabditophanes sp. KR3021 TaxID=114890 RepID=A0AC35TIJ1_9BILA